MLAEYQNGPKIINMKYLIFISISCLCLISFKAHKNSYQTECISLELNGYINIKVWDDKKGANYTEEQSRKDAIHAILFSGIGPENGCTAQPPMLRSQTERQNFIKISKSFFSKKGAWSIFTNTSNAGDHQNETNATLKRKSYKITVSKSELRKYLEEQKIITSLDNGF